jgi:hypothetical protein
MTMESFRKGEAHRILCGAGSATADGIAGCLSPLSKGPFGQVGISQDRSKMLHVLTFFRRIGVVAC